MSENSKVQVLESKTKPQNWGEVKTRNYNMANGFYGAGAMFGGMHNPNTGMGTALDASEATEWTPTRWISRELLEVIYVQSWVARKFIDIPIDDQMLRWRIPNMTGDWTAEQIEAFQDAERNLHVRDRINEAMKAAALYGAAMVMVVIRNEDPAMPLVVENIQPDSIINFVVLDRYSCAVELYDQNLLSESYGEPLMYRVSPRLGSQTYSVHSSRLIRFDGIKPLSQTFTNYDQFWGVSKLIPIMLSIVQDASFAATIAHLGKESSVPVMKLTGFHNAIAGETDEGEMTMEQLGARFNELKSSFRTIFMSENDSFERVDVNFTGWADVIDRFARRIAAAADIPATRFWAQSPVGMNATGESDLMNYAMMVGAKQEVELAPSLIIVDRMLLANLGMDTTQMYDYLFPPLVELSEKDQAEIDHKRIEALSLVYDRMSLTENEFRERLAQMPWIGELEELDVELLREEREPPQPDDDTTNPSNQPAQA